MARISIIVGRFQSPRLHEGYRDIIDAAQRGSDGVVICLGHKEKATKRYPLSFQSRKTMIQEEYPSITVVQVADRRCDRDWSMNLDARIKEVTDPNDEIVLYGSRDSFIPYYSGEFRCLIHEASYEISATETRENAAKQEIPSLDYRIGVIAGVYNRYPSVITTVDVAILSEDGSQVLLGRKPNETKFRFTGGFSDVKSDSFEQDGRREVQEETGIAITDPKYIGSFRINDWRQRGEEDQITTVFFAAKRMFGVEKASDDICEIQWFSIDRLSKGDIVEEHAILLNALKKYLNK